MENGIQYPSRISTATVGLDKDAVKAIVDEAGGKVHVARFYGNVVKVEKGNNTNGDWYKFEGGFEAVNTYTGEIYRSKFLHIPNPSIEEGLAEQILSHKDEKGFSLQVGFDIFAEPHAANLGYKWSVSNILDSSEVDPFESIKSALPEMPKKLAAN